MEERENLPIDEDGNLTIPRNKEEFKRKFAKDQAEMAWKVFAYCLLLEQGIEETVRGYIRRIEPEKMKELEKEEREERIEALLGKLLESKTEG